MGPDDEPAGALAALRIVAFESRRAAEIARMLGRHGATVISAPAMREVPLADQAPALELLARLERREVDVLVLLTGVGTRALVAALAPRCEPKDLAAQLGRIAIVARGPKPVAALRELGLAPTLLVPEPNTWRELLAAIDRELPVRGRRVAVQEYGRSNPELLAGLAERGADVLRVPVYAWALPEDTRPLRAAVARIAAGEADVAVFTTAVQLDHLRAIARDDRREDAVLAALRERIVVAAIGPSAAVALADVDIASDIVPEHPKLGSLVAAIADRAPAAVAAKAGRQR
ncbi:MAG TPA: uroporphyrinogen-III synthase [Candidatus Binatia bacterium]|nr:uroporphyrinogen-III synthase [Candidatus Binatia bacterium]